MFDIFVINLQISKSCQPFISAQNFPYRQIYRGNYYSCRNWYDALIDKASKAILIRKGFPLIFQL